MISRCILRSVAALSWIVAASLALALETGDPLAERTSGIRLGDLSDMREDGVVRVLIPYSFTSFYLDRGDLKGIAVEFLREFEKTLNAGIKKEVQKTTVALIPTRRDLLIAHLVEGRGDLIVANMTITEERAVSVDFASPILTDVRELVVTDKHVPALASLDDLSGLEVHVRRSSSYFESLRAVNEELAERGLEPANVVLVDERLEDEDLLEMIQAGILPAIVIDEHKAHLWLQVLDGLQLHTDVPLREGGEIAWAMRKNSPELKAAIDKFMGKARKGTTFGNILFRRYYRNSDRLRNPKLTEYREKLDHLRQLFQKYGSQFNIDYLLLAAQAFQESKFDQSARSRAGAIGVMQLLPSTAADPNVNVKNINDLEHNIEAGAKYMRFIADRYFSDEGLSEEQRILFAFAAYNAGPNRVVRIRNKANDPSQWFGSVEWDVASSVGTEPVRYVKNIYRYYLVFRGFEKRRDARERD
jgi:membrane-bound lytic murein transglycosylase MltF